MDMPRKQVKQLTYIALILVLVVPGLAKIGLAHAQQGGEVVWDPPINLSNTLGASTRPAIAADAWGQVHVFWSEKVNGAPPVDGEGIGVGDTIYYRRWDGTAWSDPIDIFFVQGDFGAFKEPAVAVDSKGILHLVWVGSSGVHYSQSSVFEPVSAKSWRSAQVIAGAGQVDQAELVIGPSDQIYVVYNRFSELDGYVYFLSSEDGGETWTEPRPVAFLFNSEAMWTHRPRIIIDEASTLHLSWIEYTGPPDFQGLAFYHSRSEDGGLSWSEPFNLADDLKRPEEQVSEGLLVPLAGDNLLALYIQGEYTYRRYRLSPDRGRTWYPPRHIFGDLVSRAGWDAMAVDSAGTTHLIAQLRVPYALYTSSWADGRWRDPPQPVLTDEPLNEAHYPQMAIGEGNQLHVVMQDMVIGEIWYMRGTSPAPYIAPLPLPIRQPAATPQPTPVASPTPSPTPTPDRRTFEFESEPSSQPVIDNTAPPALPVTFGVVIATLLIGTVVLVNSFSRGRW